ATAIARTESTSWLYETRFGEDRVAVIEPFASDGPRRLSVVFWFGFGSVQSAFWEFGVLLTLLGLGGLGLGAICAHVLGAQSLAPLEHLTVGARQLAKGRLGHRIELRSGDEFEALGQTLDRMAELLQVTVADLESSNRKLETANRELLEIDRVKSDLLANVSHELRTPLTAISGFVEALETGLLGAVDDEQRRALGVVSRNVLRLRSTIEQLLSFSRLDSRALDLDLRPFDLEAVARQAVEAVSAARGARGVRLRVAEDAREAHGDAARIAQVLENLLTNAVKFSPDEASVDLEIERCARGVEMRVIDRGIGLAPEHRERVFERFYQVDASPRRPYGGMGLGLAIVREILNLHGASVRIEDTPGGGSTFRVTLPDRDSQTAAAGRVASSSEEAVPPSATAAPPPDLLTPTPEKPPP
ncbi:MAG: ATP-binding protein, partial [Acidobacteriota bacterium]